MIELRQITKQFKQQQHTYTALDAVSLQVKPGEVVGLVGQSGTGKSTLLRSINLLTRPDSGEVWVNGQNLCALNAAELAQARRKIGVIFQDFNLLSRRTVRDNIALALSLHQPRHTDIDERVTDLLKHTQLLEQQINQHQYLLEFPLNSLLPMNNLIQI